MYSDVTFLVHARNEFQRCRVLMVIISRARLFRSTSPRAAIFPRADRTARRAPICTSNFTGNRHERAGEQVDRA